MSVIICMNVIHCLLNLWKKKKKNLKLGLGFLSSREKFRWGLVSELPKMCRHEVFILLEHFGVRGVLNCFSSYTFAWVRLNICTHKAA